MQSVAKKVKNSAFDNIVHELQQRSETVAPNNVYKTFLETEFYMWVVNPKDENEDATEEFAFNLVQLNGGPSVVISETGDYLVGFAGKKINVIKARGKDLVEVTHPTVGITVLLHNGNGFSLPAEEVQMLKKGL